MCHFLGQVLDCAYTIIIIIIIVVVLSDFITPELSGSFSLESNFSRTFLSILADLSNAVVRIVLLFSLISNSSTLSSKPLETVPSALIRIGITVTIIFNSFLDPWQSSSICLSFRFHLFTLYGPLGRQKFFS